MFVFWIIELKLSYCSDSTLTQKILIICNSFIDPPQQLPTVRINKLLDSSSWCKNLIIGFACVLNYDVCYRI